MTAEFLQTIIRIPVVPINKDVGQSRMERILPHRGRATKHGTAMKKRFYGRHALLILMVVFFLVPFAMRGARHSLQGVKNDVKDWLPSSYVETGDLLWFKEHFLGEQFVVVSWEGLHGDPQDQAFSLFLNKLLPTLPPSEVRRQMLASAPAKVAEDEEVIVDADEDVELPKNVENPLLQAVRTQAEVDIVRPDFIGDDLGLYTVADAKGEPVFYPNWGNKQEKWLKGSGSQWYYITPDGDLFRWNGIDAPVAAAGRWIWQNFMKEQLSGELVKSFGELDGPWYYENPRRLRAQLFKTITTGPGVYHSLTNEQDGVLRSQFDDTVAIDPPKQRLLGTLFGPDGKQTCLVATLTDAAKRDLHQVLGRGWLGKPFGRLYEIGQESGIPMAQMRLGGPPVDNVAIDEEGTITLVRLVGLSVLLGLLLSYACFRSVSATIMVFFVGGISAVISVALVWWLGSSMDAILMTMPSLVYVLGLSGSVHLMNYYYQAIEEGGLEGAAERAVAHAWKPALLCNVTTAIGLISLCTSEIVPIRKFGTFSAIGVTAMVMVVFTYLPAVLQIWPQKPRAKRELVDGEEVPWLDKYLAGFWSMLGGAIVRNHWAVSIGCTVIIAAVGFGATRIQTSVNLLRMFDPSAKIIADYQWLEENLGRLVPMEVVVKVDRNMYAGKREVAENETPAAAQERAIDDLVRLSFLNRMELVDRVQRNIEREFGPEGRDLVGKAMSAATFGPEMLPADYDFTTRMVTNKKLEKHRPEFLESDYLREDKETRAELWRISVRLAASSRVDYGTFMTDLKTVVEPVLAGYGDREMVLRAAAELQLAENASQADAKSPSRAINPVGMPILVVGNATPMASRTGSVDGEAIRRRTLIDLLNVAGLQVDAKETLPPASALQSYQLIVLSDASGKLQAATPAQLAQHQSPLAATAGLTNVSAVYTGVVPIVYKAQQALLQSLIQSTNWSFFTITPLMMFVARSWRAGMVAMLPNALPVLVVFGAMGWLGIEVDVGSMMTASIALGVAVDDTIHYLTWFREELSKTTDRKVAILRTYQRCATPTFQAALISGLGLSIFAFSTFTPTQRFGMLMLTILWCGVVAELIYFPALLAGPLGSVFAPARHHGHESHSEASHDIPVDPHELDEPARAGTVKFPLVKPHLVRRDGPHKAAQ
jgi:predicted RND superfamily exporter protein